jgi:hypothetical protein
MPMRAIRAKRRQILRRRQEEIEELMRQFFRQAPEGIPLRGCAAKDLRLLPASVAPVRRV